MNLAKTGVQLQKYRHNTLDMAGVFLGFDYGRRHIGVAVGQKLTGTATALETIDARDGKPEWGRVSALLNEWQPEGLVVGIPYHLDDSSSATTRAAKDFARQLNQRYALPVYHQDERLTSREAESIIVQQRRSGRLMRQGADIDKLAAQIILQAWLDRREENQRGG